MSLNRLDIVSISDKALVLILLEQTFQHEFKDLMSNIKVTKLDDKA